MGNRRDPSGRGVRARFEARKLAPEYHTVMPKLVEKQLLLDVHRRSWSAFWLTVAYTSVFVALWPAIWFTLESGNYWLLAALVLVQAFVMHAQLIAFHEAAHGALCPVPFINGYLGRAIGMMGFMSLTLYRA